MIRTMTLGGVELSIHSTLDFVADATQKVRETIHEMGDGDHYKQVYAGAGAGGKTVLNLSGGGVVPPGLDQMDTSGPLELLLNSEKAQNSTSNQIALPPDKYRTDAGYEPWGRAIIGQQIIPTAVSVDGSDLATLVAVSEPSPNYQLLWYPKLTVLTVGKPRIKTDSRGAVVSWSWTLVEQ